MASPAKKNVSTKKNHLNLAAQSLIMDQASALGNSKDSLAKVAADLLNEQGRKSAGLIAEGCFLSKVTVVRIMEEGGEDTYHPQADTLERVFRYFGASIHFKRVRITPRFQNKPKE